MHARCVFHLIVDGRLFRRHCHLHRLLHCQSAVAWYPRARPAQPIHDPYALRAQVADRLHQGRVAWTSLSLTACVPYIGCRRPAADYRQSFYAVSVSTMTSVIWALAWGGVRPASRAKTLSRGEESKLSSPFAYTRLSAGPCPRTLLAGIIMTCTRPGDFWILQ